MKQSEWAAEGIILKDVEPPPLQDGWVRLKVAACGICGSDLHRLKTPVGQRNFAGTPGHELVGTIMEKKSEMSFSDGLYAVEPWLACHACDFCRIGKTEQCRNARLVGVHVPGGLADFIDVPDNKIHECDPSLSAVEGSITEPFAVCTRATHLAELKRDSHVLILGGGSLGLISGLLARDVADRVAISVRYPHQEEAARKFGLEPVPEPDVIAFGKEFEPDVVIEQVGGHANTLEQATAAARPGGRIIVVGLFQENPIFDVSALVHKELTVRGSKVFGMSEHGPEFRASARRLPRYKNELKTLQTHQFPLSRVADAFSTALDKSAKAIKITIQPGA
ncbi:MAG TPA: alcohol dehydrogenase catalytic domain-containing protein [Dehalococcoidia bacterium]|nr:alcohol dehydrogenase catalytic domain-containing protein [Dehalococcoidia bacterium]